MSNHYTICCSCAARSLWSLRLADVGCAQELEDSLQQQIQLGQQIEQALQAALDQYSTDLGTAKGDQFQELTLQSTAAVAEAVGGIALVACVTNDLNRLLQNAQSGAELESGVTSALEKHREQLATEFAELAEQSRAAAEGKPVREQVLGDLSAMLEAAKEARDAKQTIEQQKEELESGLMGALDAHMQGLTGDFDALVDKCKAAEGQPIGKRVASVLSDLLAAAKEALAGNSGAEEELKALREQVKMVTLPQLIDCCVI